jgi:hypothetical protein
MASKPKQPTSINLRDELDELEHSKGPMSEFDKWISQQPPDLLSQLHEIMRDKTVGHTQIAALIDKRLHGPTFTGDQVGRARRKLPKS